MGGANRGGSRRPGAPWRTLVPKKWDLTLADLKAQTEGIRMVAQKAGNQSSCGHQGAGTDEQLAFSGPRKSAQVLPLFPIWIPKGQCDFCLGPVSDS